MLAAGLGAYLLPRAFLPPFNEGTILVNLQYNPGISLAESNRLGAIAERLIMTIPEVKSLGRRTGRAELDEHAEGVHNSEIDVDLARSKRAKEEVYAHIRAKLAVLPVSVAIGQPIAHRLDHMLSGVQAQIVVKIFGEDLDTLRSSAERLRARLQSVPGLVDLQIEKQVLIPQLKVTPDYERASLYGITPAALTEALEGLCGWPRRLADRRGQPPLRCRDAHFRREPLDHGAAGPARRPHRRGSCPCACWPRSKRATVPIKSSARTGSGASSCMPTATAGATWRPSSPTCGGSSPRRSLPSGYTTQLEGTFRAQEDAAFVIGVLSLVSLALIFMVLYQRYQSTVLAIIILTNIPLALIGSVIALGLAGQPLSVASMIGFITLVGIAARNGILKISHYINLALFEGETFGPALVLRGSLERLAPVLMTALSAGLALVPLLFGAGEPGREILHPVAVTIFGGLISSTLLDTLLTPVLFLRFGRKPLERILAAREAASPHGEPRAAEVF